MVSVACPCTVAMAIPFTLGNVMRILGRHGFHLKNTHVVEAFSDLNAVVLDKTGTITQVAEQQLSFVGEPLAYAEKVAVRSLTRHSAHPLSRQIYASLAEVPPEAVESFEETPGLGVRGREPAAQPVDDDRRP